MNLLKKLFGPRSDNFEDPSVYVDPNFGFSIRIPSGWRRTSMVWSFRATGGCVALALPRQATLNISCGAPDPQTPTDKLARAEAAVAFLAKSVGRTVGPPLRDVVTSISGQDNVARSEVSTADGLHGLISIIHNDIEYVLQYHATEESRDRVESLIRSFRLPGTAVSAEPEVAEIGETVTALDAENEADRRRAHELLCGVGSAAVPALLSSVNACTQAIVHALMTDWRAGPQIEALQRRIELLGDLRDIRGVPAMLNAIGDSAQSEDFSPEAKRLRVVSQAALVKVGHDAVRDVANVLNTPSARLRLALVEVLIRIGGSEAQAILQGLANDPDTSVREAANRASKIFDFPIVSASSANRQKPG